MSNKKKSYDKQQEVVIAVICGCEVIVKGSEPNIHYATKRMLEAIKDEFFEMTEEE